MKQRALVLFLVLLTVPTASAQAEGPLDRVGEKIVNGVVEWTPASVGFALVETATGLGSCTGTLIGCRTFLTAAHCVCKDVDTLLTGVECQARPDLLDPTKKLVFFQHAGFFSVSSVSVHPDFEFKVGSDLAVFELAVPVPGIRPSRINQTARPATGSTGLVVGFGRTGGANQDVGVKRAGLVETAACSAVPAATHQCWDFVDPLGPPGEDSNTCQGDSGGPLYVDLGSGPVVAGVTSGGSSSDCLPTDSSWDADVFVDRAWIESTAGADLHDSACGSLPFAGEAGASTLVASNELSSDDPSDLFPFDVPSGVVLLEATLNGSAQVDADLYLRRGSPPTTTIFDCESSSSGITLEECPVLDPDPGTWYLLARRADGEGLYQATVTLYESGGGGGGGSEASIVVEKRTIPGGDPATFTFTGDVAGSIGDGQQLTENVGAGTYTATETVPTGWSLASISCDDNDSTGSVGTATATLDVSTDETVTCVFTNCSDSADVTLDLSGVTVASGEAETFEACDALAADDFVAEDGSTVTFRAGRRIVLGSGVEIGGSFAAIVVNDP